MAAPQRRVPSVGRAHKTAAPKASPLDCLSAEFLAEAREGSELPPPNAPEVAFAGRSNVGKSTLLNRLVQRKGLARTSRTPGCTRGVVLFQVGFRDGAQIVLTDLPGYGFADRSKAERKGWGGLIETYLLRRAALAGVVILVDGRRGFEAEEQQLMDYLRHIHRVFLVAVTKIDKLTRNERPRILAGIGREAGVPVVGVSGETGEGREDLLRRLLAMARFEPDAAQPGTPPETPG